MAGKADSWPMTATAAVKQRAAGAQVKPSAAVQSLRGLEAFSDVAAFQLALVR